MAFKAVMQLEKLQQDNRQVIVIDGHKVLLIWHDAQVYAIQSQCPHLKLPLTKGAITDQLTIVCPFHKSEFDLCTGETKCWSPWPPVVGTLLGKLSKEKKLKIYPSKIDNGQIFIDLI